MTFPPHPASQRPAAPDTGSGRFQIHLDRESGAILVEGSGFWTAQVLDAHFDNLYDMVARRRTGGYKIKVLVDLRHGDVQSVDVITKIGARTSQVYETQDRVAIVVATSLFKMQLRRTVKRPLHNFFTSLPEAQGWLHEEL
jgi:hypothetical protein